VNTHLANIKVYKQVPAIDFDMARKHLRFILCNNRCVQKPHAEYMLANVASTTLSNVPKFYLLPKVHKTPIASRPIVAAVKWILTPTSKWLDYQLQPLIRLLSEHILKDTNALTETLDRTSVPQDATFVAADVESLYTNINTHDALDALRTTLQLFQAELEYTTGFINTIVCLTQVVLQHNYFQVGADEEHPPAPGMHVRLFHQISGTAMGTNVAPPLANIFVWHRMRHWRAQYQHQLVIEKRLIDDILLVLHSDCNTDACLHDLQTCIGINLTWTISCEQVDFLDLTIFKGERFHSSGHLDYKVFQKTRSKFLYLPFNSAHPRANKVAFVRGELLRYRRNCTNTRDFEHCCRLFYERLRVRGFPAAFLKPIFAAVPTHRDTNNSSSSNNMTLKKKPPAASSKSERPLIFKTFITPTTTPSESRAILTLTMDSVLNTLDDKELHNHMSYYLTPPIMCVRRTQNIKDMVCNASHY